MRGLSWPPSSPLTPGDGLDAGRADTRHPLRPPPLTASHHRLAHTPAGCGHGGTRNRSTSRRLHTRSVRPAAIAGVWGRHCLVVYLYPAGNSIASKSGTIEFITIKSSAATGSDGPGSYAGHSRVPS